MPIRSHAIRLWRWCLEIQDVRRSPSFANNIRIEFTEVLCQLKEIWSFHGLDLLIIIFPHKLEPWIDTSSIRGASMHQKPMSTWMNNFRKTFNTMHTSKKLCIPFLLSAIGITTHHQDRIPLVRLSSSLIPRNWPRCIRNDWGMLFVLHEVPSSKSVFACQCVTKRMHGDIVSIYLLLINCRCSN